jgi:dihydroorotate dehydrogenase (NAD+) catalytic subunit
MPTTLQNASGLIRELAQRFSYAELANEVGVPVDELRGWEAGKRELSPQDVWKLVRVPQKHGFFDLIPAHGITPVSYNLDAPFDLLAPPVGYDYDPPLLPLHTRPTLIAGHRVDFPLGLPASVLAANAKWIEFYARRGFDILTYKTVRTQYRQEHPWPNWVFLENPRKIVEVDPLNPPTVRGFPRYWPDDLTTASMANSFGIPSFAPGWWQEDIRRAREVIREGHQVLIVSIVASTNENPEAMIEDFVQAATMAKNAGADIIEANYSCPNTPGDRAGDVYLYPEDAKPLSRALRDALGKTPLFVKIGYLPGPKLRTFLEYHSPFIDGIVAINTISAKVIDREGKPTFPGKGRETAGVSGCAIKTKAQEVAKNLIALRQEFPTRSGQPLTILGLGGVLTKQHVTEYLDDLGVDAVESCTGAFLNPHLGLDTRCDADAAKNKPSRLAFELKVFTKFLQEVIKHPTKTSRIRANSNTGVIVVERRQEK